MKNSSDKIAEIMGIACLVIILIVAGILIFTHIWNITAVYFGFKTITYRIATCILLIAQFLKPSVSVKK